MRAYRAGALALMLLAAVAVVHAQEEDPEVRAAAHRGRCRAVGAWPRLAAAIGLAAAAPPAIRATVS